MGVNQKEDMVATGGTRQYAQFLIGGYLTGGQDKEEKEGRPVGDRIRDSESRRLEGRRCDDVDWKLPFVGGTCLVAVVDAVGLDWGRGQRLGTVGDSKGGEGRGISFK